jgi:four helix bundle protein
MADQNGIDQRVAAFVLDVVVFIGTIVPTPGTQCVVDQLVASADSVNTHRGEATNTSSKRGFIRFNEIALLSAHESVVWLRACEAGEWGDEKRRGQLLDEGQQICTILGAIVLNAKRRR